MTTLATLRDEVYRSLGNRNDTDAQVWADRGINVGMIAYTLLNEPPECRTLGYGNAVAAGTVIVLSTQLTRHVRLERVYNNTGSCPVLFIPFRMWDLLYFPTSGNVQFYTLYGNSLYYKPLPTSTEQLYLYYFQLPARLDDSTDVYPFAMGEDFVLAFAKKWAWACLEEKEDSDMWSGLATDLALPEKLISDLRKYVREEWGYGADVSKALSKGTAED